MTAVTDLLYWVTRGRINYTCESMDNFAQSHVYSQTISLCMAIREIVWLYAIREMVWLHAIREMVWLHAIREMVWLYAIREMVWLHAIREMVWLHETGVNMCALSMNCGKVPAGVS